MKLSAVIAGLLLAAVHMTQPVNGYTNPIVIKNYKMFDAKTGKYFGVRGVDYYPRPNTGELDVNNHDFFTDDYESVWKPDLAQIAALGANAVRLYAVDPSDNVSHDKFMCALRSYGMYALIDFGASCTNCAITKDKYPACYPAGLKTRGQMIINHFAKYDNVLAFSAGNEVNNVVDDATDNAPCQKKFIRDMREYIGTCSTLRKIPVGVVLADEGGERETNAKYYNCRTNTDDQYENAEWYGLNVYLHCDGTVTDVKNAGGFQTLLSDFTSYKMNIPVMLTEFGCLNPSFPKVDGYFAQRTWLQAGWLHNSDFRKQFNGGFVFEYSTENANSKGSSAWPFTAYGAQNYGLGYYTPQDCDHKSTACSYVRMPNFDNLAEQYNATDYSAEPAKDAFTPDTDKVSFPTCPSNYPTLASISWTTVDGQESLACPSVPQDYTCSGQTSSGTWTGTTTAPSPTSKAPTSAPTPTPSTTTSSNGTTTTGDATSPNALGFGPFLTTCAVASAVIAAVF